MLFEVHSPARPGNRKKRWRTVRTKKSETWPTVGSRLDWMIKLRTSYLWTQTPCDREATRAQTLSLFAQKREVLQCERSMPLVHRSVQALAHWPSYATASSAANSRPSPYKMRACWPTGQRADDQQANGGTCLLATCVSLRDANGVFVTRH